jgi:nicotinamide-nucleotide adenylyltransferase
MKALFIGRFQPFHIGHLFVVQRLSTQYEELIIGIGSSQYHDTSENPFTYEERKQMIQKSLDAAGISTYRIVALTDIHDPPHWVAHVQSIVSNFDVVIANNPFTRKLFSQKNVPVKGTAYFDRKRYSGKEIRRRMIENEPWTDLVPQAVVKIIRQIQGVERVKKLSTLNFFTI